MAWQWVEFLHSVVDPHYTPPALRDGVNYREGVTAQEAIREASQRANEYNQTAQATARNVETTIATVGQGMGAVGGGLAGIPAGPAGIVGGAIAGAQLAETEMNAILALNKRAPVQSLDARVLPAGFGGDSHYRSGGRPENHPSVMEHRREQNGQIGATPMASTQNTSTQNTEGESIWDGILRAVASVMEWINNKVSAGYTAFTSWTGSANPDATNTTVAPVQTTMQNTEPVSPSPVPNLNGQARGRA
ncbi:MAG: hypothetical protein KGJ06_05570 [Pseudomonadota bacterium]|nr:hypothetical protein [Pseudomonadota bacterium]